MKYSEEELKQILTQLSLEEKASLCSGSDFWHTKAIDRLQIPSVLLSDGPHGLRKQKAHRNPLGLGENIEAVCYPTGSALASSFDKELMNEIGNALGEEARSEGIHTLLGPAVNIKRNPLCGRNFEYLSEDPHLNAEMACAYIEGVQSQGINACVKHYALNNCENDRMRLDVQVDERTLREIYLPAFEKAVCRSQVQSIMASYNKVHSIYACEHSMLLSDILRREWGFEGVVISDWGAVNNRCQALDAGLDLEMPSSNGKNDLSIVDAIQKGKLCENKLDETVLRLLRWIHHEPSAPSRPYDREAHHHLAKKAALASAVLLKNAPALLPLKKDCSIAFIGEFAQQSRIQGGGSSHVRPFRCTCAMQAASDIHSIRYARGFSAQEEENTQQFLLDEAVALAQQSEVAVLFLGLKDQEESEGYDRSHLHLSKQQDRLVFEVVKVQPNTVVVLSCGSPITMPWIEKVPSVLLMHLGGQAVGEAVIDLLFGQSNPCGKLAETYPLRLQDTPAALDYQVSGQKLHYREGIFTGYRYYDKKDLPVLFPFGHGLSYTSFSVETAEHPMLCFSPSGPDDELSVSLHLTNTGNLSGAEVLQLYIAPPIDSSTVRPLRELKAFTKVFLQAGDTKPVTFRLKPRDFSYYETQIHDWFMEGGIYTLHIGNSSRNMLWTQAVDVTPFQQLPFVLREDTTIGDLLRHENSKKIWSTLIAKIFPNQDAASALNDPMAQAFVLGFPIKRLPYFYDITSEEIDDLLQKLRFQ